MHDKFIFSEKRYIKSQFLQLLEFLFYENSSRHLNTHGLQECLRSQSLCMGSPLHLLKLDALCQCMLVYEIEPILCLQHDIHIP